MACLDFDLINSDNGCFAIKQGATFDNVKFYWPEDLTGCTPQGVIRKNYKAANGELLATFTFPPVTYGPVIINGESVSRSLIWPKLTDEITSSLPVPKSIETTGEEYIPGTSCWVYGVVVPKGNGDVIWIARGIVDVIPGVV